ncbi:hypothetical protein B2J93_8132 [Marssonina coronariae]|uniref:Uncharacterized protein n=1 Tax=Diplocarpon coronariae TaxID=2795749 RepID=A0A218YTL7_9HELO|nr:hypothetical protein B2J93_8132 [Marssonina coronariae]
MDLLRFRMAIEFAVGYPKWSRNTVEAKHKDAQIARLYEDISQNANAVAPAPSFDRDASSKNTFGVGETTRDWNVPLQSYGPLFPLISSRNDWTAMNPNRLAPASLPVVLDFQGVILWTPVFDASATSLHLISIVCEMLLRDYNVFFSKDFVMEIHVYRKTCRPYTGIDIANFLATVWKFEHLLDTLHAKPPPSAVSNGGWLLQKPLHARHLQHNQRNPNPRHPGSWPSYDPYMSKEELECVLSCRNLQEVIDMTYGPHGLSCQKYGFCDSPIPSIRFNQHESTLDSASIKNWLMVCFGLVVLSDSNSPNLKPAAYLRWALENPGYTVMDLLWAIGLPEQAEYYGARKKSTSEKMMGGDGSYGSWSRQSDFLEI